MGIRARLLDVIRVNVNIFHLYPDKMVDIFISDESVLHDLLTIMSTNVSTQNFRTFTEWRFPMICDPQRPLKKKFENLNGCLINKYIKFLACNGDVTLTNGKSFFPY